MKSVLVCCIFRIPSLLLFFAVVPTPSLFTALASRCSPSSSSTSLPDKLPSSDNVKSQQSNQNSPGNRRPMQGSLMSMTPRRRIITHPLPMVLCDHRASRFRPQMLRARRGMTLRICRSLTESEAVLKATQMKACSAPNFELSEGDTDSFSFVSLYLVRHHFHYWKHGA